VSGYTLKLSDVEIDRYRMMGDAGSCQAGHPPRPARCAGGAPPGLPPVAVA